MQGRNSYYVTSTLAESNLRKLPKYNIGLRWIYVMCLPGKYLKNIKLKFKWWFLMVSYKLCAHPHPPTLAHTYLHPAKKRSRSSISSQKKVTFTQPPATLSQKKVTLTRTHLHLAKKGYTHPHPAKKGHTHLSPAVNLWKRKFFITH